MAESMSSVMNEYGTLLLFTNVLLVQLGLPIPAVPLLILAGGLAAAGQLDPVLVIVTAVMASTLADYCWYLAGRCMGHNVLLFLCRLTPSPELWARKAEASYNKWGGKLLLLAKFIPGVAMIVPPIAGVVHMPCHVFLMYAGAGGLLWVATFVSLGYALESQTHIVFALLADFGHYTTVALAAVLATYLLYRLAQRKRRLRGSMRG